MRIQLLATAAAASATIALSAGAGGTATGSDIPTNARAIAPAPQVAIGGNEAARFAKQASFGPTPELIDAIVNKKTYSAWLDDQFNLSSSSYEDIAQRAVPATVCSGMSGSTYDKCYRDNFEALAVQMRFYSNALTKEDQLRQRVAFALSQIIVTSEAEVHITAGLAGYNQILLSKSFGNYRDILEAVTLNAYMGDYLDMADSSKIQPNENYARELMQLFSIGTVLLNSDGTAQVDASGDAIPAYGNNDVKEVARALTGWTWPRFADGTSRDWSKPMVMAPTRFDAGSKTFLGKTIPAGASQQENVAAVVDAVFNHPNIAPFICKRLIQQLITANPSPAYVGRVASAFANNGAGVRGDMKAVIRAIYLDEEARVASQAPGKLKEPVLLVTSLARAIGYKSDGYAFTTRDAGLGQSPFRAPSVFNFYPYEFPLSQGDRLVSPASKLMHTATNVARHNLVYDWTIEGDGSRAEFGVQNSIPGSTGTQPVWASWEANGADDAKTIDRINLVMLNGAMTPAQRQSIVAAMASVKNSNATMQARRRAQVALYIVASSPLFQVDR